MKHYTAKILGDLDERRLWNALLAAVNASGALVVGTVTHGFSPTGFSGVVLLGESHVSVHTWPEDGYGLVDYFSCRAGDEPAEQFNRFAASLRASNYAVRGEQTFDR